MMRRGWGADTVEQGGVVGKTEESGELGVVGCAGFERDEEV